MPSSVVITDLDELATAPWTDPEINHVNLFMVDEPFQFPAMSAQVTSLAMQYLILRGPITLPPALETLKLGLVTSEASLSEWNFPSSLKKITVGPGLDDLCDLSRTQSENIEIAGSYNFRTMKLPETLRRLSLGLGDDKSLPTLPPGLRCLKIWSCLSLEDYSGAEMITELDIDRVIPFEQYFPNLEKLTVKGVDEIDLTMSMPELKTLSIYSLAISGGLELDTPNLVSLSLEKVTNIDSMLSRPWGSLHGGPRVDPIVLPKFPLLESLELIGQLAQTNGVRISSYDQYVRAWGGKSAKNARSAIETLA